MEISSKHSYVKHDEIFLKKKWEENNYRTSVEIFVAERILGNVYRNGNKKKIKQTKCIVLYRIVSYCIVSYGK